MKQPFKNLVLLILLALTVTSGLAISINQDLETVHHSEPIEQDSEEKTEKIGEEEIEDKLLDHNRNMDICYISSLKNTYSHFKLIEGHLLEIPTPPPQV